MMNELNLDKIDDNSKELYIPNYHVFKELNPLLQHVIVRGLENGLFGDIAQDRITPDLTPFTKSDNRFTSPH